jgi:sulfate adenylyltransferase
MSIKPHGGRLVNKVLSPESFQSISKRKLKRIKVCWDFILDLEKIAIGDYSPLTGFMKRDDFKSVLYNMRLETGEPWTIPIFFSLQDKIADKLSQNEEVVICEEDGREVGLLRVEDKFSFHKFRWAKQVFGTDNKKHPGVKRLFDVHGKLIGGEVWLIRKPDFEFEKFNLTPAQTRQLIEQRGWKTVAGFQTRNIPHRAHEYLQKLALSITDGILIHPIIGWKKDGDFKPELIIDAYRILINKYFPKHSVIFAGLATAMRYAGPREAVFHAIIRKNYGCTHFIVGRDHAGVGNFYEKYDAHKIFERFADIGITPLLLREPYYCRKCNEIVSDRICPHGKHWHDYISGTKIRKFIGENRKVPVYMMRREVVDAIHKKRMNYFI